MNDLSESDVNNNVQNNNKSVNDNNKRKYTNYSQISINLNCSTSYNIKAKNFQINLDNDAASKSEFLVNDAAFRSKNTKN